MKRTFKDKTELVNFLKEKCQEYRTTSDPSDFDDFLWELCGHQNRATLKDTGEKLDYNALWELFDKETIVF